MTIFNNPKESNAKKTVRKIDAVAKRGHAKWENDLTKAGIAKKDRHVLSPEELSTHVELSGKQ